jgi:hypothetical protein
MTSLAEAEAKYGHLVHTAGLQVFGIETSAWCGGQEEKLKIGTLDGFLKLDVVLNQPDIDAVLRARAADIARYAHEIRTRALPSLSASSSRSARK